MLFNSYVFAGFFIVVYLLYWMVFNRSVKTRNAFLLLTSYLFYGWWDWRFLLLLMISSAGDFLLGHAISKSSNDKMRKNWLMLSLTLNLGILGFFKYSGFFIQSFSLLLEQFGFQPHVMVLQIILPVGISFYTFQSLGYIFDVYRKKINPASDVISYLTFVSFFPQLVAGPIERAGHLMPQFSTVSVFREKDMRDGLRRILWGLFKKIVIADTCAVQVNYIFEHHHILPGSTVFLGAVLFAFQIYGDFSGYSDMAIGLASMLGFSLMKNFNTPYFSQSFIDFWRRWHISLSTWFRDYVYIPIGGNRFGKERQSLAVLVAFTISGFWHGAGFHFIAWGLFNGLLMLPSIWMYQKMDHEKKSKHRLFGFVKMSFVFTVITLGWILFRSNGLLDAMSSFHQIFSKTVFENPTYSGITFKFSFIAVFLMLIMEWIHRNKNHGLDLNEVPIVFRWLIYIFILACICLYYNPEASYDFIYFQF